MVVVHPPAKRLAWVWTAPLGRPVVPEVYMSSAWSLGLTGCRGVSGALSVMLMRAMRPPGLTL
jgi:hypothetical protein